MLGVMWRGALVIAVAGCGGQPAPPPEPPPTCAAVADHVRALMPAGDPDASAVRTALETRCASDGWAADALRCMYDEPSLTARHHCKDKLTAPQREALDADIARAAQTVSTVGAYRYAVVDTLTRLDAILAGKDCVAMAGEMQALNATWHARTASANAWQKAHAAEAAPVDNEVAAKFATKYQNVMAGMMRCNNDPAFQAALAAFNK